MHPTTKVVLAAVGAGVLGIAASLLTAGPGPWLRSEIGQKVLNTAISASAPPPAPGVSVSKPGEKIPALDLTDIDGKIAEIPGKYLGRPLLVNVWASWCAPCLREMPELQHFYREQAANGVQVVGIALDDPDSVRQFLRKVTIDYPVLLDPPGPGDAGVRLGNPAGVLPYSVLVSADGHLLKQHLGPFQPGEIARWVR